MFDIGFWELMLIGIMGLIILGPERLPVAIRTVRGWIGDARKFGDTVKTEITEELRIHELHEHLKKAEQGDMSNLSPEVAASIKSLKDAAASVNEPFKKIDTSAVDDMVSSALARHDFSQGSQENSTSLTSNVDEALQDSDLDAIEKEFSAISDRKEGDVVQADIVKTSVTKTPSIDQPTISESAQSEKTSNENVNTTQGKNEK